MPEQEVDDRRRVEQLHILSMTELAARSDSP
jgi:hypothetical protein